MKGKPHNNKISAVVLSGGKSSRMGADKGLIELDGKAMIMHGIDIIAEFIDDISIGTNNDDYAKFGYPLIKDEYKNCGPIGGLHAALSKVSNPYVFILSCDMPEVKSATLKKLIEAAGEASIVIAKSERGVEPMCGIYSKTLLPDLENRIKQSNYKMQLLLRENEAKTVFFSDESQFKNINRKEDFR